MAIEPDESCYRHKRPGYSSPLPERRLLSTYTMIPSTRFETVLSVPLYNEYRDVLSRSDVIPNDVSEGDVADFVDHILIHSRTKNIYYLWRHTLGDRKDDMILELAVPSAAGYIVTFNVKDFANVELFGIEVVTPSEFLRKID